MRKRIYKAIVLGGILTGLCFCTGCEKTDQQTTTQEKSSQGKREESTLVTGEKVLETVTGAAVSGGKYQDFVDEIYIENTQQPQIYATQNYIYMNPEEHTITQIEKATGKKEQYQNEKISYLWFVTEDALYVSKLIDDDLYRIPLEKGADGKENILFDKMEKVLHVSDIIKNIYVYSHYIVYITHNKEDYLFCYDFSAGQMRKIELPDIEISFRCGMENTVILCPSNEGGYWCFDIEKGRLLQFEKEIDSFDFGSAARADNYFFYNSTFRDGIYVYDMEQDKRCKLLSEKEIDQVCKANKKLKQNEIYMGSSIDELFACGNKLYIQMSESWKSSSKKEYSDQVILSYDLAGRERKLKYMKKLTEFLHTHSDWTESMDEDLGYYNSSGIFRVVGDTIVFVLDTEEELEEYAYNISTGDIKKIGKDDKEYYYLYVDLEDPDTEMEDRFIWDWDTMC